MKCVGGGITVMYCFLLPEILLFGCMLSSFFRSLSSLLHVELLPSDISGTPETHAFEGL